MVLSVMEGLTFVLVELKNFSKFDLIQKQTNVGHIATDEIINSNSKNIGYRVNKGEVLGFKKNRKPLMISPRKVHVDRFLKSTKSLNFSREKL